MKEKEFRRNMAVFPIGSVMKLTDLSARQIRYYEDQNLITPARNEGNRRMYSLNDMDRLLEIKDIISLRLRGNMLSVKPSPARPLVTKMFAVPCIMTSCSKAVLLLLCQPLVRCVDHSYFV